jgi:hypothetical protein
MKKLFPILSIFAFLMILAITIYAKIVNYELNLSSLINIWEGFARLNPDYIPKDFVVYKDGGYDGQFFYILAQFLYNDGSLEFPIVDSFYFRFHRLGLSMVVGSLANIIGWKFYAIICLAMIAFFHVLSSLTMYSILSTKNKFLFLFYLFSAFSILSTHLLVSDSLLVSFCIISLSLLILENGILAIIAGSVYMLLALFVRETSVFVFAPLFLYFLLNKNWKKFIAIMIPLSIYLCFYFYSRSIPIPEPGTLPLKFIDMVDFPLFGFVKSFQGFAIFEIRSWIQNSAKIFLFILYMILLVNLSQLYKAFQEKNWNLVFVMLPLLPLLSVMTIAEEGYWRNFDNLARMFVLTIPLVIFAKELKEDYKDFGFLPATAILTGFIFIRIVFITKQMTYAITQ